MNWQRELAAIRVASQGIGVSRWTTPVDAVTGMGALQAQDYAAALWAVGLRSRDSTRQTVLDAVESAEIVRTWPMRGTLHFLAAKDARWMVELLAPRAIAKAAGRARQLEIDDAAVSAARGLFERELRDGGRMTRAEAYAAMEREGLKPEGQRGIHMLGRLAQEGALVVGPHRGKQPTFVLAAEWLPPAPKWTHEEALAEVARRYFASHGPATQRDFAWWTGLTLTEARLAAESVAEEFERRDEGKATWLWRPAARRPESDAVYLLPGFDEYILGYTDRLAVLAPEQQKRLVPGNNGMFLASIVTGDGKVLGTWRKRQTTRGLVVAVEPFGDLEAGAWPALEAAAEGYAAFDGLPLAEVSGPP